MTRISIHSQLKNTFTLFDSYLNTFMMFCLITQDNSVVEALKITENKYTYTPINKVVTI